jgi:hypothetical protein
LDSRLHFESSFSVVDSIFIRTGDHIRDAHWIDVAFDFLRFLSGNNRAPIPTFLPGFSGLELLIGTSL